MVFPSRQAAIVGVYTTEQGRNLPRTSFSLALEAIKGAVGDAGLTMNDIGGVMPMGVPLGGSNTPDRPEQFWATQLGGRPLTFGQLAAPTPGVHKAALAIAAGMCDVVVVFWGKAGWQVGPGGQPLPTAAPLAPGEFHYDIFGGGMVPFYAMWAQRYMHEFGATSEDLAEVAVIHREHATLNPASLMGSRGKLTVEDVMNSRMNFQSAASLRLLVGQRRWLCHCRRVRGRGSQLCQEAGVGDWRG